MAVGWSDVGDVLGGLFDFARVVRTSISNGYSVLASLRGTEGGEGANEDVPDCEVWGVAGVQSRPKPATTVNGEPRGAEVFVYRNNDELLGIASRDLRYQVVVAEGELAIHALGKDGATQAIVRLKPYGVVIVEGVEIRLGADATDFVALASKVNAELEKISDTLISVTGGSGSPVSFGDPYVRADVDATKTKAE